MSAIMVTNSCWKLLAVSSLLLSFAHCNGKKEEEYDIQYVIIGGCLGTVFAVTFIAIKLYMIKKHMLDNVCSDSESFQLKTRVNNPNSAAPSAQERLIQGEGCFGRRHGDGDASTGGEMETEISHEKKI
ncbi:transmembrane protein 273 isoform X2 [Eleutherodactylus coqui]|uniref:transmembrane protein 273 isoform X2 n=1 Tax=Eleutherodactylus coqui TaxID=57060 RepID=UPI003461823B